MCKNTKKKIKCKKIKEIKERDNRRDKITEGTRFQRDKMPKGLFRRDSFRRDRKKREKKRIARQHKLNEGEERKVF